MERKYLEEWSHAPRDLDARCWTMKNRKSEACTLPVSTMDMFQEVVEHGRDKDTALDAVLDLVLKPRRATDSENFVPATYATLRQVRAFTPSHTRREPTLGVLEEVPVRTLSEDAVTRWKDTTLDHK